MRACFALALVLFVTLALVMVLHGAMIFATITLYQFALSCAVIMLCAYGADTALQQLKHGD